MDCDTAINAANLFGAIFHESLHFVSMNQGAGFRISGSDFKMPEDTSFSGEISQDDLKYYGQIAEKTVVEGATKLIEHLSMDALGINTDGDEGYGAEKQIMIEVLNAVAPEYDQLKDAYFTKSIEDIRKIIERNLLPPEEKEKYNDGEISTGEFMRCLLNIGYATEEMHHFFEIDDFNSYKEVFNDVHAAAQYYRNLIKEQEMIELNYKASNIAKAEKEDGLKFFDVFNNMGNNSIGVSDLQFLFHAGGASDKDFDEIFSKGVAEVMNLILEGINKAGFLGKLDTKNLKS